MLFAAQLVFSQTFEELISKGDEFYKNFNNYEALDIYQQAGNLQPNNYEALWRISRAYVDIGEHLPNSTDEQEKIQLDHYQRALNYANKSVKNAPDQSVSYLRRAIANGRIALFKGVFSVAGVVNAVKADCEKAIALGNGGDDIQAVSHYVYARTHAKISEKWAPARAILGLGWADLKIGIKEYKKAISLKPNFVMFYLDFAHAYIADDNEKLAIEMLKKTIDSPIEDEDDAVKKEEAKALLKKLQN
ncbi:MAG: hypothetical protein KJ799_17825 [Bacteroidetes bacterium]|nr:hypothetical protein [Bacteroidota bacterium]MBU1679469.1 hypothetical protein [Bacteroidota bacterium]MBU2508558.1 hypothetical protein [Bacteroidota bacterium]